ncbi:MAG: hypothetical protein M1837_002908 [Sclerophora amabilis]|nr:MAG: hypothetical protein M1837_002908 [Sclerophora amabilis]
MPQQVFLNIRITDLPPSIAFYEAIGFTRHPHFHDETTVCMTVAGEPQNIHVMLIKPDRFRDFCPPAKSVADPKTTTEILMALSADRREEVDEMVEKATRAGGKADPSKITQMEGMYGRSFEDLDGHVWEIVWVDVEAMAKAGQA